MAQTPTTETTTTLGPCEWFPGASDQVDEVGQCSNAATTNIDTPIGPVAICDRCSREVR